MNEHPDSINSQNNALGRFQVQYKNILSSLGVTWFSTISKKNVAALLASIEQVLSVHPHNGELFPSLNSELDLFNTIWLRKAPLDIFREFCFQTGRGALSANLPLINQTRKTWTSTPGHEYRILPDVSVICAGDDCRTDITGQANAAKCPQCGNSKGNLIFLLRPRPYTAAPRQGGTFSDILIEDDGITFESAGASPRRKITFSEMGLLNVSLWVDPGLLRQSRAGKFISLVYDKNAQPIYNHNSRIKFHEPEFRCFVATVLTKSPQSQVFDTTWNKN